jgi:hypothetical protein
VDPSPSRVAQQEAVKQAVILAFAVMTLLVFMWLQRPDSLRAARMRAAAASSRVLSSLSRRAGHTSMGIELTSGTEWYQIPLWLSMMRDKVRAIYDREAGEH